MIDTKIEPENFKLFRVPAFSDLEFARVSNQTHVFPRHWNETGVIQVIERGINEGHCRGATYRVSAGSILFINPHEIHTGSAAGPEPLVYRSLYPTPELLIDVASQCRDRSAPLPFFQFSSLLMLNSQKCSWIRTALARPAPTRSRRKLSCSNCSRF